MSAAARESTAQRGGGGQRGRAQRKIGEVRERKLEMLKGPEGLWPLWAGCLPPPPVSAGAEVPAAA